MFVDDLILLKPIPTKDSELQLQKDLDAIQTAYSTLFLTVNPLKSQLFLFSLSPEQPQTITTLCFNDIPIPVVTKLKYLGFLLDRRLNFAANMAASAAKGKKQIGALFRAIGRHNGSRVFARIYLQKIMPHFLYGLPVTAPASNVAFGRLERVHRFAARLICNDYRSSYDELLNNLCWKSVGRMCFERRCILAHKYIYGLRHLPSDCLKLCVDINRRSARIASSNRYNSLQLFIPWTVHKSTDRFPIYQLFATWNALPDCVVIEDNPRRFNKSATSPVIYAMVQHRAPGVVISVDNL